MGTKISIKLPVKVKGRINPPNLKNGSIIKAITMQHTSNKKPPNGGPVIKPREEATSKTP